jgi:hypothetical protein
MCREVSKSSTRNQMRRCDADRDGGRRRVSELVIDVYIERECVCVYVCVCGIDGETWQERGFKR